jgi:hypothetical protein
MSTTYPTAIRFDVTGPHRERVLAAAQTLGLTVRHDGPVEFYVTVTSPQDAYALGREYALLMEMQQS